MAKYVYQFKEGNASMKNLLGGKGANLAEMTTLGLPVPGGFTVTTEACTITLEEITDIVRHILCARLHHNCHKVEGLKLCLVD